MSGSRRRQSQAGTGSSTPQPCQGSKEGAGQGPDLAEKLRHLVHKYADQHQYGSALFWASNLASLTEGSTPDEAHSAPLLLATTTAVPSSGDGISRPPPCSDRLLLAEILIKDGQYHRAAKLIRGWGLERSSLRGCHLCAKALAQAGEAEEALDVLDNGAGLLEEALRTLEPLPEDQREDEEGLGEETSGDKDGGRGSTAELKQVLSSIYLLKGQVLESLDNRGLACESFREALRLDVFCAEALRAITAHQMLTAAEERELLGELPVREQCAAEAGDSSVAEDLETLVSFLYRSSLKKYARPDDVAEVPELKGFRGEAAAAKSGGGGAVVGYPSSAVAACPDVAVQRAEAHFYNCDYERCYKLTSKVLAGDPYHTDCLPVHVSCLIELNYSNRLFNLAHKLVELFPEWSVAWFSVGAYYYLVGKQEFARRYLCKATQLDRVFGAAWLAYGHSFARENEHDQAMAAYFKACQLMKGCHLPLLYIGVEYGLTNNSKLAERFFNQAIELAPEDPFVLHELGVVSFQNQQFRDAERFFLRALHQVRRVQGSVMPERWESLLNNLGHTSRKLGRFEDALHYHRSALVLRPLSASTYSAIGYAQALKGDLAEAVEAFHKALSLRRDDTFATTMLTNVIEQLTSEDDDDPPFLSTGGEANADEMPKFQRLIGYDKRAEEEEEEGGGEGEEGEEEEEALGEEDEEEFVTPQQQQLQQHVDTSNEDIEMADASLNSS